MIKTRNPNVRGKSSPVSLYCPKQKTNTTDMLTESPGAIYLKRSSLKNALHSAMQRGSFYVWASCVAMLEPPRVDPLTSSCCPKSKYGLHFSIAQVCFLLISIQILLSHICWYQLSRKYTKNFDLMCTSGSIFLKSNQTLANWILNPQNFVTMVARSCNQQRDNGGCNIMKKKWSTLCHGFSKHMEESDCLSNSIAITQVSLQTDAIMLIHIVLGPGKEMGETQIGPRT